MSKAMLFAMIYMTLPDRSIEKKKAKASHDKDEVFGRLELARLSLLAD